MITYPSTFGVFEENVHLTIQMVHAAGGQVYMDGANMNAQCGLTSPGFLGADVCHLNLHKTFCIPHGGGGPGVGPIGVQAHLKPFLPQHPFLGQYSRFRDVGPVTTGPYGSASILPVSWMYLNMMGSKGLREASFGAILSANYMRKRLEDYYPVHYTSKTGFVAHEFILDVHKFGAHGIKADDICKRLMDFGFHAPTVSWPVAESLMIEPTESESKQEIDRFIEALIFIRSEIQEVVDGKVPIAQSILRRAPHTQQDICDAEWDRPYTREQAAFPLPWVKVQICVVLVFC
jgi:glycine dehydrogenase